MRKLIAAVMLASLLLLCACGEGASVSYYQIKLSSSPDMIVFSDGEYPAMKEKITYFSDEKEDWSYSLYIEATGDYSRPYSVIETSGDYSLYASQGDIFAEKGGKLYAVLLMIGTFYDYVDKYISFESDLDCGSFYQLYSRHDGEITTVAYFTEILPEVAAKYSPWGFSAGDRLVSEFEIYSDYRAKSVTYYLEKNGVKSKLMMREFEYLAKPEGKFPSVSEDTRNVTVVYDYGTPIDTYQTFSVPQGCGFGFETGDADISLYLDPEYTLPFDYEDTFGDDPVTIYAKRNFD